MRKDTITSLMEMSVIIACCIAVAAACFLECNGTGVVVTSQGKTILPAVIAEIIIGSDGAGCIRYRDEWSCFEQFQSTSSCAGVSLVGEVCLARLPSNCQFLVPYLLSRKITSAGGRWVCSRYGCKRFPEFEFLQDIETGEDLPVRFD